MGSSSLASRIFSPIALLSPRVCTLIRTTMSVDKHEIDPAEVEHIDHSERHEKGAINPLLVVACAVFGAASFMFGYDDKVISPIIALPAFVSLSLNKIANGLIILTKNSSRLKDFKVAVPLAASPLQLATRI